MSTFGVSDTASNGFGSDNSEPTKHDSTNTESARPSKHPGPTEYVELQDLNSKNALGLGQIWGKADGTRLFTITEQSSVNTLKTLPSTGTFQNSIVSSQLPSGVGVARVADGGGNLRRRECFSLDDTTLYKLHQQTSTGWSSSSEQSPRRFQLIEEAKAAEPPFTPPERIKTPEGVPRWPGERLTTRTDTATAGQPREDTLLSQIRARGSRVFRTIFGPPSGQVSPQPRPWRPPVSGHATFRYAGPSTHPFARAPSPGPSADTFDEREYVEAFDSVLDDASAAQGRTLSPSERTLQRAAGNSVPVTPERARVRIEGSQTCRRVSLPNGQQRLETPQYDNAHDTLRTIELLDQFSIPPPVANADSSARKSPKRRALSLSLFPRVQPKNQRNAVLGNSPTHDRRTNTAPAWRLAQINEGTQPSNAQSTSQLRNSRSLSHEECEQADSPPLRGENSTRYRLSGTPVHDEDAASLRSYDCAMDDSMNTVVHVQSNLPANRPETGTSRYYSASSTAACTAVEPQTKRHADEQVTRSLANGAGRYNTRCGSTEQNRTVLTPVTPPRRDSAAVLQGENEFPITPVTITRVARNHCPHKLAKMRMEADELLASTAARNRRWQLDGTSPPPNTSRTAVHTPLPSRDRLLPAVPPSSATIPDIIPNDNQTPVVTTNDFARRALEIRHSAQSIDQNSIGAPSSRLHTHITSHRRHPAYGTWRTRMKRHQCWKCELEARRRNTAAFFRRSRENLSRSFTSTFTGPGCCQRKWIDLGSCLRWTCFCRYSGYEDDSDEETGRARTSIHGRPRTRLFGAVQSGPVARA